MSLSNLAPLPWSCHEVARPGTPAGAGYVYLLDANGRKIGTFWGTAEEKMATLKLLMDASEAAANDSVQSRPVASRREAATG
jgi:hypothetical protein